MNALIKVVRFPVGVVSLIISVFAFLPVNTRAQPLSYTVDSAGFQSLLDFEGGDCEFEFADINDDGHLDILCVGDHGSPFINTQQHGITIFLGNGTGTGWTLVQNGDFGYGGIAVGDVNNDGFKDVGYGMHHNYAATDFGDQVLEVALGDGTGNNWIPWDDSLGLQGQSWGMFGTDFADIDNDGWLDIGSNSFGCCDGVHIHRNGGNGTWPYAYGFIGGNSNHWFEFGDINNDGFMDFVAAREGGVVYFGNGTGMFINASGGLPSTSVYTFDDVQLLNADSDPQLEMGFCYDGGIFLYKWYSTTQQWQNISGNLPSLGSYYMMQFADMNNDNILDVAASTSGQVSVFTGAGNNVWNQSVTIPIPNLSYGRFLDVADVDHSGRPDILLFGRYPAGMFNSINKLYLIRESSVAVANTITPVYPDSARCFPNGATRFITWQSVLVPGTQAVITLEYNYAGGPGTWDTIAAGIPDNGSYQWTVPMGINSAYVVIRYTLSDNTLATVYATALSAPFNIGCQLTTGLLFDEKEWSLYPNPANEQITLRFAAAIEDHQKITITDAAGRSVLVQEIAAGTSQQTINISKLPPGCYLIHIGNGMMKKRMVVIRD